MGNYLFCQECVVKALKISNQKLSRQWKVKQRLFQHPIKMMTKSEVNDENLNFLVVMPEGGKPFHQIKDTNKRMTLHNLMVGG